jgi:hypothetical protein
MRDGIGHRGKPLDCGALTLWRTRTSAKGLAAALPSPSRPLPRSPLLTRRVEGDGNELGFQPGASPRFLFSETRARPFDREEMLCMMCNIADTPSCHVRTHICQAQARSAMCVPDREIGKILLIGKVSPIGQMFPIGRSRRYCRSGRCRRSGRYS